MTTTDEMACIELVAAVTEYLEGTLPEDDRQRLEAHLEKCPYCVEYIEQFRQTIEAMGSLSAESIPPERRDELLEVFRGWRERKS